MESLDHRADYDVVDQTTTVSKERRGGRTRSGKPKKKKKKEQTIKDQGPQILPILKSKNRNLSERMRGSSPSTAGGS